MSLRLIKFTIVLWMLALLVVALSGCTAFRSAVGPQVAKAVNRYCLEPFQARILIRSEVNGLIQPHTIRVDCAGDPTEGSSAP